MSLPKQPTPRPAVVRFAPVPTPSNTQAPTTSMDQAGDRDSNALRASVLDAALELGLGTNSTVAKWIFNNPTLEEVKNDGDEHLLSPIMTSASTVTSDESSPSIPITPPTYSSTPPHGSYADGTFKFDYTHKPANHTNAVSGVSPPSDPRNLGSESTFAAVSNSLNQSQSSLAFLANPPPVRPFTPSKNKLRKKRDGRGDTGTESDGYVSESGTQKVKAPPKKKGKKVDVSQAGYETDSGYLPSGKKQKKGFFRIATLRSKSSEREERLSSSPLPPLLPQLPTDTEGLTLPPIAERFATTLGTSSQQGSRVGTLQPMTVPGAPSVGPITSTPTFISSVFPKPPSPIPSTITATSVTSTSPSTSNTITPPGPSGSISLAHSTSTLTKDRDSVGSDNSHPHSLAQSHHSDGRNPTSSPTHSPTQKPSAGSGVSRLFKATSRERIKTSKDGKKEPIVISYPITRLASPPTSTSAPSRHGVLDSPPEKGHAFTGSDASHRPNSLKHRPEALNLLVPHAPPNLQSGSSTPSSDRGMSPYVMVTPLSSSPHSYSSSGALGSSSLPTRPRPVLSPINTSGNREALALGSPNVLPSSAYLVPSPSAGSAPLKATLTRARSTSPLPSPKTSVFRHHDPHLHLPPPSPPPTGPLPAVPDSNLAQLNTPPTNNGPRANSPLRILSTMRTSASPPNGTLPLPTDSASTSRAASPINGIAHSQIQRGRQAPFPAKPVMPGLGGKKFGSSREDRVTSVRVEVEEPSDIESDHDPGHPDALRVREPDLLEKQLSKARHEVQESIREGSPRLRLDDDDVSKYPDEDDRTAGRSTMYLLEHESEDRMSTYSYTATVMDSEKSGEVRERFVRRVMRWGAVMDKAAVGALREVSAQKEGKGDSSAIPPVPKLPEGIAAGGLGVGRGMGRSGNWI